MKFLQFFERLVDYLFSCFPRPIPSKLATQQARLIAHRGAHDKKEKLIENTMAAFSHAQRLGCWGIEFDIHATLDEVLVVNHDPDLLRLWGKAAYIRDLTFKQLRAAIPQIPSLSEVIANHGKCLHLFIELKAPFTAEKALVQALEGLIPGVDYHLLSLDSEVFSQLAAFPLEAKLLVAVHNNLKHFCNLSLKKSYAGVLGHYFLFTGSKINNLKQSKQQIGVGFVDSKFSLYRELNRDLGWLFTNKAALISRHLAQLTKKDSSY